MGNTNLMKINKIEEDKKLLEDIRSGKVDFSVIYNKHLNMCKKMLMGKGVDYAVIKDVYQNSMITFYNKIINPDFVLTCKISTYLYSVIYNNWLIEYNQNKKYISLNFYQEFSDNEYLSPEIIKKTSESFDYKEDDYRIVLIKNKMKTLPDNQSKLLNLLLQDLNNEEIRAEMNCSSDALKTAKNRVLNKIREQIL